MLSALEKVNTIEDVEKLLAFSMDVVKLYPSLKSEEVARLVAKAFLESELEVAVEETELGLYLALTVSKEELSRRGLGRVTHTWRKEGSRGATPGITTAEVFSRRKKTEDQMSVGAEEPLPPGSGGGGGTAEGEGGEDTEEEEKPNKSLFDPPKTKPTKLQTKKMMALALEVGVKAVMQGHMYQFDGKVYLQSEGGPIGLELTGAVSRVVMLLWDRGLLQKLHKAAMGTSWDLYAYLRYVDDANVAAKEAPPGMRYIRGKFKIKPELVEEDNEVPGDLRTAYLVRSVGHTIFDFIRLEVDCPSLHPDTNRVPILDLEVGVENNKLTWRFYRKKMANFLVLMERSAMSDRQKRVSLTQEVVRILRNTERSLPEDVKNTLLSEFSLRMKMSGYSAKFRLEVITCGVACYEKQLAREEAGTCPLYRPKGYLEEERRRKRMLKKRSWYRPFTTVLFCPPSPGSKLALELRKVVEEETRGKDWKVKIIERAGVKLQYQLPGLKEPTDCGKDDCFTHTSGGKGNCRKEGVLYRGICLLCLEKGPSSELDREERVRMIVERKANIKSIYWGESSFGAYTRGQQHLTALRNPTKHKDNAFVRHREDFHRGEEGEVRYRFEPVRFYTRAMARLVGEGCYMLGPEADILMNSKLDHCKPAVGRVVISNTVHSGRRRNPG